VTVLAGIAELADDIDVDRARQALESAESAEAGDEAAPAEAPAGEGHAAEQVVESPTMLALLHPDLPEVRARRARARLEAAGVLEGASAPSAAPSH